MNYFSEVILIMILTGICCSLPGCYLVLRRWAMMGDAISHSVLLGVVLAFFIVRDLDSPLLLLAAAIFALFSVFFVHLLSRATRSSVDSALGISFTFFFALAVILISRLLRHTHIDLDVVLLGEVALAPLRRISFFGLDLPYSLVQMGILTLVNLFFVLLFYKGLKLSSFDPAYAQVNGFSSLFYQLLLMGLVSFTTVSAFDAVGAVLVVSFLVTPAATAYFFTRRLSHMILLAAIITTGNALVGSFLAQAFNVPYSGATASFASFIFFLAFFFRRNGLVSQIFVRRALRRRFCDDLLILHLYNHRPDKDRNYAAELGQYSILRHLNWSESKLKKHTKSLAHSGYLCEEGGEHLLLLNKEGETYAEKIRNSYGLDRSEQHAGAICVEEERGFPFHPQI